MRIRFVYVWVAVVLTALSTPCSAEDSVQANAAKKQLEEQYAVETARFHSLQTDLQSISGRTDVSSEGLQKTAARLDDQLEALQLEEVGSKVRIEAVADCVAQLTKKGQEQAGNDEVVFELKKVVEARERALARVGALARNAAVAAEEVDKANADLAEAKIRLLERAHGATTPGTNDSLAAWNRELISLTVNAHERHAREQELDVRLKRIRKALSMLPELQFQEEKMKRVRARLISVSNGFAGWVGGEEGK